jgi:hypothetical protein
MTHCHHRCRDDLYIGWPPGGQGFSPDLPSKGVDFKPIAEYEAMAAAGVVIIRFNL